MSEWSFWCLCGWSTKEIRRRMACLLPLLPLYPINLQGECECVSIYGPITIIPKRETFLGLLGNADRQGNCVRGQEGAPLNRTESQSLSGRFGILWRVSGHHHLWRNFFSSFLFSLAPNQSICDSSSCRPLKLTEEQKTNNTKKGFSFIFCGSLFRGRVFNCP